MKDSHLLVLLNELVKQPHECEWVEFKLNYHSAEEIGEQISALANGACLYKQSFGYLVFGVEDKTHNIVGTTFHPKLEKKGSEEIEDQNAAIASRIIRDAIEEGQVKEDNPTNKSRKYASYIPFWA